MHADLLLTLSVVNLGGLEVGHPPCKIKNYHDGEPDIFSHGIQLCVVRDQSKDVCISLTFPGDTT